MSNLTRQLPGNGNFGFNTFKNKSKSRSEESSSSSPKVIVIPEEHTEAIIIPKNKIDNLRESSDHFKAHFLSSNFPNVRASFTKNGDFILKKKVLEERFGNDGYLEFYDRESYKFRKFKTNEVWNGLVNALLDDHIDNALLGKLIADYFMFDKPTFHNPKVEEQTTIAGPTGHFVRNRKSRKQRKEEREKEEIRRNYNALTYQNILEIIEEERKENQKIKGRERRNETRALTNLEQRPGKGTGKNNKRGNTRKILSKYRQKKREIGKTLKRKKQHSRKHPHPVANNSKEYNSEEYNSEEHTN